MPVPESPPPAGPLRRTAHALLHLWPRKRTERPATRQEQLAALMAILDDAVAAQPVADRVVAACGRRGPVSGSVTHTGGEQMSVYHKLNVRLSELSVDDDFEERKQRAARFLAYHQWILHQAVSLACATSPDPRVEAARLRMRGLGDPAEGLRDLRDEVKDLAERVSGEEAAR